MFIRYHFKIQAQQNKLSQQDRKLLSKKIPYQVIMQTFVLYDVMSILCQLGYMTLVIFFYRKTCGIKNKDVKDVIYIVAFLACIMYILWYNFRSQGKTLLLNHFRVKSQSVFYVDDVNLHSDYMKNKASEDKQYIKLIADNKKYNINTVILKRSLTEKDAFKVLSKFSKKICFMPAYYDKSNKLKYICNTYRIDKYQINLTKPIKLLTTYLKVSMLLAFIYGTIPMFTQIMINIILHRRLVTLLKYINDILNKIIRHNLHSIALLFCHILLSLLNITINLFFYIYIINS